MKAGSAEYDALVARKMREREEPKVITELPSIEEMKEAARAGFDKAMMEQLVKPKRRGRPKGSRNKPK